MKKAGILLSVFLLLLCAMWVPASAKTVRVKLFFTVGSDSIDAIKTLNVSSTEKLMILSVGEPLFLTQRNFSIEAIPGTDKIKGYTVCEKDDNDQIVKTTTLNVSAITICGESSPIIKLDNAPYRGVVVLQGATATRFNVINELDLEEYLYGVVASEMEVTWPIEALKAQAIAARSYAYKRIQGSAGSQYDLTNTQSDQAYGGVAKETDSIRKAVDETKGLIAYYEGNPVQLYFFSCTGKGITENNEDVWGAAVGYLRGKTELFEAERKPYEYTFTSADLERRLKENGKDIGRLTDIRCDKISASGSVVSITFVGTKDSKTFTKGDVRTMLGLGLRSQWFTVSRSGGSTSSETGIYTTNGFVASDKYAVVTKDGVEKSSLKSAFILTKDGIHSLSFSEQKKADAVPSSDTQWVFTGTGHGHGVGMSQYGAFEMAKHGYTYDQILAFYFTGITLGQLQ